MMACHQRREAKWYNGLCWCVARMSMGEMGNCQLCGRMAELKISHILSSFIYKDFKKTSLTGRMRATNAPNLPIEDGLKEPLLCGGCEQRLCEWERLVSKEIYAPSQ